MQSHGWPSRPTRELDSRITTDLLPLPTLITILCPTRTHFMASTSRLKAEGGSEMLGVPTSASLHSIWGSGGKRLPFPGLWPIPSPNPERDTMTGTECHSRGKERNNSYSGLCQGHNLFPTPSPSPLITQNINIQRQEGEAEQFSIQGQDSVRGPRVSGWRRKFQG